MKLVRAPIGTYDKVELRETSLVATRYESFFPFGRIPVEFEERPICSSFFAGRIRFTDCEIDFEDEHEEVLRQFTRMFHEATLTGSCNENKRDIELDGFRLMGVFPLQKMGGTVWRCSIDCFEKDA
jgi:hypothetical protein